MRNARSILFAVCLMWPALLRAQTANPPEIVGTLAGAGAPQRPDGIRMYGTDLGWTFAHHGDLFILFGDSWRDEDFVCDVLMDGLPTNDDAQALLPRQYTGGVPSVSFATQRGSRRDYETLQVFRDGVSLHMGANRTPMTGFSDGDRAVAVMQSGTFVTCSADATCIAPFECAPTLGQCRPSPFGTPQICDVERQAGCFEGQTCEPVGSGFCVDPTSSQPGPLNQVPLELEFAVPRARAATQYDSRFTWATNKFLNLTARTIRRLDPAGSHSDYAPGSGALLIWGRPGFYAGPGFDTALYLLAHDLPLRERASGELTFRPRYFAGLDRHGRARWSPRETDAAPLALDGRPNGDPSETYPAVNQQAISWLDAPIRKWVMLYGGGTLLGAEGIAPGMIALRFADHPWGPWSPPQLHLSEGAPDQSNTPLGPGGVLFHPACAARDSLRCAASDPVRPAHILNPECAPPDVETDVGYFYAPNIIDAYTTRSSRTSLDMYWNLSAWNPYRVLFLRTRFHAR